MATERDPLLAPPTGLPEPGAPEEAISEANANLRRPIKKRGWLERRRTRVGPMEIKRTHRWSILAGVWMATFLSFQQANQASWLGTSYLLATCTFTPLYGRLCNVMGRRGANHVAVLSAGIGVMACGFSRSMPALIIARFISGMGGGGIFTTSSIITSDMFTMRERSLTQGIANIFNGLGMGLGGPIGGLISDKLGWRWAFLLQLPLFVFSFLITSVNLTYVTPGKGKSTRDILKRIDYPGFLTLFITVGSLLVFMSYKYNDDLPWSHPGVIASLIVAGIFSIIFVLVELYYSPEPIMAPFLLVQKDPVLISISNFLVALCNFSVMYFFPMWFQTVMLDSASIAGLHLMPNSVSMSLGSLFSGWFMHRTGEFKKLMVICGIFPFVAGVLISQMTEDSGFVAKWLSIIPLGFGNAVVLQTTLIALLTAIPHSAMAVGTGFGQLFRGIGQVFGVAIASAVFQALLDKELRLRLTEPGSEDLIRRIRQSSKLVLTLEGPIQRHARDSYAIALRAVFIGAAGCTLTAYIVRLFITARSLDTPDSDKTQTNAQPSASNGNVPTSTAIAQTTQAEPTSVTLAPPTARPRPVARKALRRYSTYEGWDGQDPEVEGQDLARSFDPARLHNNNRRFATEPGGGGGASV